MWIAYGRGRADGGAHDGFSRGDGFGVGRARQERLREEAKASRTPEEVADAEAEEKARKEDEPRSGSRRLGSKARKRKNFKQGPDPRRERRKKKRKKYFKEQGRRRRRWKQGADERKRAEAAGAPPVCVDRRSHRAIARCAKADRSHLF